MPSKTCSAVEQAIVPEAFYSLLGLAMRAGALTLGESGVHKAVASGHARCVLLDAGASENTKKKFRDACAYYEVELFFTEAERLGRAVGKPGRMSAAVAEGTLGDRLCQLARDGAQKA